MYSSIYMRWEEKRYINCGDYKCKKNKERQINCPTNYVLWWKKNQFWLPRLDVVHALELVICLPQSHHCYILFDKSSKLNLQDGFLKNQHKPATTGNRDLRYNVADGKFHLRTKSYARIKCDMDFGLYPFDTQKCELIIFPKKNLTYQATILRS